MDASEGPRAACRRASEATAHIDAKVRAKMLKRAEKFGMTADQDMLKLIEAWKAAGNPEGPPRGGERRPHDHHLAA